MKELSFYRASPPVTAVLNCEEMQFAIQARTSVGILSVLIATISLYAQGQDTPKPDAEKKDAPVDAKPIPPRAGPSDYLGHVKVGDVTIAAEFTGHSVPTPGALLSTEDYVAVEVAIFGAPDAKLKLSYKDFALRINGKKNPTPAEAYTLVFKSLKDPDWEPPAAPKSGGTSISSGGRGGGGQSDSGGLPPVVHIPLPLERAMALRVQKAALAEDEHVLPQAGLIFFAHHGKVQSIELIYAGPAGKATLALQP
jgi:hypothetical protein